MTSIRQQVFEFLKSNPDIPLKELKKEFRDRPTNTIRDYYRQFKDMSKDTSINLKKELEKIIKDYKQPASARVQAIREYRTLIEVQPEEGEDSLLKLYQMVEKDT